MESALPVPLPQRLVDRPQHGLDPPQPAVAGRWRDILGALGGVDESILDGRHHPCPKCGGKDRFRALDDFDRTGAVFCNQCFSRNNGDGLAALGWLAENAAFRGRGLLARFLYAAPQSWIGRRQIAPPPVSQETRESYRQLIRDLGASFGNNGNEAETLILGLSTEASAMLIAWETEIESMLADGGEMEIMRDWGAKLAGATLRLAELPRWEDCQAPERACPRCGSWAAWWDALGRQRCGECEGEALERSLGLAGLAAQLRQNGGRRRAGSFAKTGRGRKNRPAA